MTAEDYLKNKEWVKRIEVTFESLDRDKDGVVTLNDIVCDVKKYSHLNPDPKVVESLRIAQIEFAAELGIKAGISMTKEEYVRNYANLAPVEVAKVTSGEESVIHKLLNKLFDVIDKDHDGTVSREKWCKFIVATEVFSQKLFHVIFELLGVNKTVEEFIDFLYRILFTLEHVICSGMLSFRFLTHYYFSIVVCLFICMFVRIRIILFPHFPKFICMLINKDEPVKYNSLYHQMIAVRCI